MRRACCRIGDATHKDKGKENEKQQGKQRAADTVPPMLARLAPASRIAGTSTMDRCGAPLPVPLVFEKCCGIWT